MNPRLFRPALLAALLLAAAALPACFGQAITASIDKPKAGYVRLNEPVVLDFNQKVDPKSLKLAVDPVTPIQLQFKSNRVMVTAPSGWRPNQTYTIKVQKASSSDHSLTLSNWKGRFNTQPVVGIAGYLVDGKPATAGGQPTPIGVYSKITITFTAPMKVSTTIPTINDNPAPASAVTWAADSKSVELAPSLLPFQAIKLGVAASPKPVTVKGDVASDLAPLNVAVKGIEPSNSTSGIAAGFQTQPAFNVVIDNAGLARPQAGLQTADIAWEYISEYSISRFTLTYFNNPPGLIGPVRSCRMINPYLGPAFHAITFCSGASDGTLGWLWGKNGTSPGIPVIINDYDTGNHFYRADGRPAPHNVFTDASHLDKARQEMPIGGGNYNVDLAHPDNNLGDPADPPSVPLHGVTYGYDGGCQCYRPFDSGSPRVDAGNGNQQLGVKNVVLIHVPYGNAGWVEDVNGGAQSIQYGLNGDGPAEIWSGGKMVHAAWHMGKGAGQNFWDNNNQPIYFTDANGQLIRLNTGLTWIHVLGNGQTS